MKTNLTFLDAKTGSRSDCGDPLEIEISSAGLNWEGILIEKGHSPHFYPTNVITPNFYFALATESLPSWKVETPSESKALSTEAGQVWINPPNTPFTHFINEPCYFIILAIDQAALFRFFDSGLPKEKLQFLGDYNIEDQTIQHFMELILKEAKTQNRNGYQYVTHILKAFATYFVRNYSNFQDLQSQRASSSAIDSEKLKAISEFIEEHLEADFGIDQLAQVCKMSRYYFLKEFKKATGTTPYQYILRCKLERAKEMLRKEKIITVAHRLGFSDQSHFSNSFKRQFGFSPGELKSF